MFNDFINTFFWVIVIVWGVSSVFLTKLMTNNWESDFLDKTWYGKIISFILGCIIIAWLAWPLNVAAKWMESFQSHIPPFDSNLRMKGVLIMLCWMIFTLQLFYRLGFKAGKENKKQQ